MINISLLSALLMGSATIAVLWRAGILRNRRILVELEADIHHRAERIESWRGQDDVTQR